MNVELLGFIAGAIILFAQSQQVIKSFKTKQTKDISLMLYVMLFVAVLMWTLYGLYNDYVVLIMNGLLLILISMMIYLKLRYGMSK